MIRTMVLSSAAALALSACALLSTPDPVQLYRFGAPENAAAVQLPIGAVDVAVRRVTFPESAEGDRILTVTGVEAAYLAGARWTEPAPDLFAAALDAAVTERGGRVRLLGARDLTQGDLALDVDVGTFETRYAAPGSPPTVVMTARARLVTLPDRQIAAERAFSVERPVAENRVAPIVQAYDAASRDLTGQIAAWLNQTAGAAR